VQGLTVHSILVAGTVHSFVISRWLAAGIALLALFALLGLAHGVVVTLQKPPPPPGEAPPSAAAPRAVMQRRRGIKALVIGADGRASTSKLQAVMWTFAVFYALVFLLVWGRSTGCSQDGLGPIAQQRCAQAAMDRGAFQRAVTRPLQPAYYVLLGFPLAAAVAAKAITVGKLSDGTLVKPPIPDDHQGTREGLGEIVANDRGETDLIDFQYASFNLLTLAFFALEFLAHPRLGLPDLPPTLIALAGLSAATYTTKKALETTAPPTISTVIPQRLPLVADSKILIAGAGFGSPAVGSPGAHVMLDGVELPTTSWQPTRIYARLPPEVVAAHPGAKDTSVHADLVVIGEDGPPSDPATIELFVP